MDFKPANNIQDLQYFGEFGGVNPSISDSSTYTFIKAKTMFDTFEGNTDGCYLYSRHTSPSNLYLGEALAAMEGTETANVAGSGMGAITATILQICGAGDHIVSSRTIYGGTYAFLKNFTPRMNIETSFVDITKLDVIEAAINSNTKMIYCESVSNPLLEVADIKALVALAKKYNLKLVVDNTFSPLSISPAQLGADIVIHSLTKFINGSSDTMGGVVCASSDFINAQKSVIDGASMLLGSSMDSLRSSSILKNMRTLHIRMKQHSKNAAFLAEKFEALGIKTVYPGLKSHPSHEVYKSMMNNEYGFGGMLTIDAGSLDKANALMELMQEKNLGYLAVSLGFYKTLFSAPGTSTSSEIPEEEQAEMGLTDGLIRFSIGLDNDIERTFEMMKDCMLEIGVLKEEALA
ncbi:MULTISPECIES: aminotransferase class I/II-fold pyridoxal phosphate-dependent enzyme [unclassified Tenacibaculum]|uniref:aminotransferase class I/II-fold pyridoxal phosphate-dependent enzyme n=1 Tax=unclassified Tenacibaculum TaxID=2635139 RepID=UPI001F19DED5|nr:MULTISPECIES: aminotransferase class I/II-fold pyridoxal phosphate-dependent enzyme [unclassified Tenacibaculum]MCF2875463.1 aminotransferase class I/II-fold pyridoxal phosphate-dependent enzyme [Tenacibaculum sp. Cn5-1]MCF2935539.1 aminotransferase class I/II-fold pyridoxal phosphate-dependent enzyme [Tenacibaculum sp. Cn5-34]MCG7512099.1 aminotransferase class I/II-fold pyridoxal phosphate-dependent enzyme [Tenacibaculum sp. Cn5-46]